MFLQQLDLQQLELQQQVSLARRRGAVVVPVVFSPFFFRLVSRFLAEGVFR